MKPSEKLLKIDNFPDVSLLGCRDTKQWMILCMKSRTGYVIMVANCPIMWQSLQSETALSTTEAEIVALAHSCCNLFPIMNEYHR